MKNLWGGSMSKKKKKKALKNKPTNKKNRKKKKSTNKKTIRKSTNQNTKVNANNKKIKSQKKSSDVANKNDLKENKTKIKNKEVTIAEKKKKKINKVLIRKIFIFIFLIACISAILLFMKLLNDKKNINSIDFESVNIEEYLELYNSEELQFIYLMNDSCMDCSSYENIINKLQIEYKLNIKKFDLSRLKKEELSNIELSSPSLTDGIDIPMILAIKNGDEINSISGVKEYSVLQKFIESSQNPTESNSFEKISIDKYLSLLNSKDTEFIYIGNSNNSGCKTFTPILEKVSQERKLRVYYLNTDNLNTSDDWSKLENSNKIFKGVWFMPTILVIKNEKIKDYKMETLNQKDLEKFLKKNGL